jgi:serine/threonine protein kinase
MTNYEVRVAGRFKMGRKIGSGSFGEIYLGVDEESGKQVAIKFESKNVRRAQVIEEAKLLRELNGITGFPKFLHYG